MTDHGRQSNQLESRASKTRTRRGSSRTKGAILGIGGIDQPKKRAAGAAARRMSRMQAKEGRRVHPHPPPTTKQGRLHQANPKERQALPRQRDQGVRPASRLQLLLLSLQRLVILLGPPLNQHGQHPSPVKRPLASRPPPMHLRVNNPNLAKGDNHALELLLHHLC